jgi:hypothetical protein
MANLLDYDSERALSHTDGKPRHGALLANPSCIIVITMAVVLSLFACCLSLFLVWRDVQPHQAALEFPARRLDDRQAFERSPEQEKIIDEVQVGRISQASNRIYKLDADMKQYYSPTIYNVGRMQSPVILAMFNGDGGKYVLRQEGRVQAVEPVPATYQKVKSVSHTLLAIFAIVSPYFENSETGQWRSDASAFNQSMTEALATLDQDEMPAEVEEDCRLILEGGIAFLDKILKKGTCTANEYSTYAKSLLPLVNKNIMLAGKLQVDHFVKVVRRWRTEMGEEEWSRLYTVVNSAWAMRRENVHFQILAQMMGRDAVNTRLIMAETVNDVTEDDLLTLLGRIVNDRSLSILVFDETYRMDVELMGEAANAALQASSCPQYPALNTDFSPYEDHRLPGEK